MPGSASTPQTASLLTPDRLKAEWFKRRWIKREVTLDRPYQRGNRGKKVRQIQEWLGLHGQQVVIDGDFGPATEQAVRQFQAAHRLPETGIVNEETFLWLVQPLLRALSPLQVVPRNYNGLIVAYARQHLTEHPLEIGGQNRGPWVRLYTRGMDGREYAWCAGFVCFILWQAALTMDIPIPVKYTLSVDLLAADAKEKGIFISEKNLKQGNPPKSEMPAGSLFLNRRIPGDWVHTGIVTEFQDDHLQTIEGNTNDDGAREGYEVCQRIRGYQKKDFIRIS